MKKSTKNKQHKRGSQDFAATNFNNNRQLHLDNIEL